MLTVFQKINLCTTSTWYSIHMNLEHENYLTQLTLTSDYCGHQYV